MTIFFEKLKKDLLHVLIKKFPFVCFPLFSDILVLNLKKASRGTVADGNWQRQKEKQNKSKWKCRFHGDTGFFRAAETKKIVNLLLIEFSFFPPFCLAY